MTRRPAEARAPRPLSAPLEERVRTLRRTITALAVAGLVALGTAATTGGTSIENTATATYVDAANTDRSVTSNTVTTIVQTVYDFEVVEDAGNAPTAATDFSLAIDGSNDKAQVNPGDVVQFVYTVTNNTNDGADLTLSVLQDGGAGALDAFDFSATALYEWVDTGDGVVQAGELSAVTSPVSFAQESTRRFVVEATVPAAGLAAGDSAVLDLVATRDATTDGQTGAQASFDTNNLARATLQSVDLATTTTVTTPAGKDPEVGDTVVVQVVTTNAGPDDAGGVQVSVNLPSGLSAPSFADGAGGAVAPVGSTVEADGSTTYVFDLADVVTAPTAAETDADTIVVTATVAATDAGGTGTPGQTLTVAADVVASDQLDADGGNDASSDAVLVRSADLAVAKTTNPAPAVLGNVTGGDTFEYVITVTNNGPNAATGIEVTDTLPAEVEVDPAGTITATAGAYDPATGLWDGFGLANGATATLTIPVRVLSGQSGAISNTATLTASGPGQPDTPAAAANDTSTVTLNAVAVDLALSDQLTYGGSTTTDVVVAVERGDTITYAFAVTNGTATDATGVEATVVLPAGLSFDAATGTTGTVLSDTLNPDGTRTVVFDLGTVAGNGSSGLIDLTLGVLDVQDQDGSTTLTDADTLLTIAADVTAVDQSDSDPANDGDTEQVDVALVDLSLGEGVTLVSGSGSALAPNPGARLTLDLTVSNAGPDTATGVTVTDVVPVGLTVDTASLPAGVTYDAGTRTLTWTPAAIAAGGSATVSVPVTVDPVSDRAAPAGSIDDADRTLVTDATITAHDQTDAAGPDTASNTILVGLADVAITGYTVAPGGSAATSVDAGDTVVYTVTVANAGPDAATGVAIADLLPAGVTFDSAQLQGGATLASAGIAYAAASDTLSFTSIAAGTAYAVEVTVTVDAVTSGGNLVGDDIAHTIEVTATDQSDVDSVPANGAAGEDDIASVTLFVDTSVIGVAKRVTALTQPADDSAPTSAGNPFTVTFEIVVENLGENALSSVEVVDDLDASFGVGNYAVASVTASGLTASATFDGSTDTVAASGSLAVGASATVTLTVEVHSDGSYGNAASARGVDGGGNPVSDDSDDGSDPDPDGNDDPSEGDSTPIVFGSLALVKSQAFCSDVTGSTCTATGGSAPRPGDYIQYGLTARNDSAGTVTGIVVTDTIPANTEYVSASAPAGVTVTCSLTDPADAGFDASFGACPAATGTGSHPDTNEDVTAVRWSLPSLASGASSDLTLEVRVP